MTPDEQVATVLILGGLAYLGVMAVVVTAHLVGELRKRRTAQRAATPDPHRLLDLTPEELHGVHIAIAFAVALGRIHDDTYVIEVRACPEHGRDLSLAPADLAGFDSLADLPEWSAS